MLLLGFFFLLHPGEYTYTDNPDAAPFWLCDNHLFLHNTHIPLSTSSEHKLAHVIYIALEFTTQKNGVHGELIQHVMIGNPMYCPVQALTAYI